MARPSPRARRLAEAAFLRALARTGNAREAARTAGANRATLFRRRAADPAFAARWDAAVALAAARLAEDDATAGAGAGAGGADPGIVRRHRGRLQLRRRPAGHLTPAARTAFLRALSASANVRLAAAAAGHSHAAFYGLRRRDPGFEREWRLALERGYEALELALLAGFAPEAGTDDAWRHNDPPAIPAMTAAQALQLLHLHNRTVRGAAEPVPVKRRRGESHEMWCFRLSLYAELRQARAAEAFRLAEAARADGEPGASPDEPPALPDLAQVTGWSKADPARPPHDPDRALFGGWQITDWAGWDDDWQLKRKL